jgi:hypothetical protein
VELESPYCRAHRPPPEERARWATKTREARGYGSRHITLRKQAVRLVESGQAVCVRCGLPIAPGTPFDLDHDETRTGYLGVSHRTCNRRAGGRKAAVTNARRRAEAEPRYVRHWSRVWSWPIPPDTYVDPEVVREYLQDEARCDAGQS